jgi:hypothetical protein
MYTVKKTRKNSIANIFVVFHFKEKQKKWNSVFTILQIPCKFQQNRLKKVAVGLNPSRRQVIIITSTFEKLQRTWFCSDRRQISAENRTAHAVHCQKEIFEFDSKMNKL